MIPEEDCAVIARIDADTFEVVKTQEVDCLPTHTVDLIGWLNSDEILCRKSSDKTSPVIFNADSFESVENKKILDILDDESILLGRMQYVDKVGRFLLTQRDGDRTELHDFTREDSLVRALTEGMDNPGLVGIHPDGNHLLLVDGTTVSVMYDALKD